MKWDGITLAEVVKTELYGFFERTFFGGRGIISKALEMSNAEYADFLRMKFRNSGKPGCSESFKTYIKARDTEIEIVFKDPVPEELESYFENSITLTWSTAARHIRAWENEKQEAEPQKSAAISATSKSMKFDKGMKYFYADIGRALAEKLKPSKELDKLISDGDPKPLREYLKEKFRYILYTWDEDERKFFVRSNLQNMIFTYSVTLNSLGAKNLTLTWSQLATLLRDDDFREKYVFADTQKEKPQSRIREQWDNTHLCGSKYHNTRCEFFLETDSENTTMNGKRLDRCCYYCTSENKIRKIGSGGSWTGLSPKFCPKRKALEQQQSMCDMCDTCANNDESCLKPTEGECIRYVSKSESETYLNANRMEEEEKMTPNFNFKGFISEGNQLKQVPIDMLVPYHNHKFKLYEGERLDDMVNSIKENGVLTPIIVRNMGGEHYEILAGHNRTNAARLAGLSVIPAIVKENLSDDEAEMYVIETNVMQRGFNDLSISERAAVVAARHSAMFDEDKRKAIERELAVLNGNVPVDEVEEESSEKKSKLAAVGENYGLSKDSVARLVRINTLDEQLKSFIDEGDISVRAGVNLSYLQPSQQQILIQIMLDCVNTKISMKQSELLRQLSSQNNLTENNIREIVLLGKLSNNSDTAPRKPIKVKISADIGAKYFPPNLDEDKVREIIELALEQYFADTNHFIMDENDEYQI